MKNPLLLTWDRLWSTMLTKAELEILSAHAPHGTHARYNAHLLADERVENEQPHENEDERTWVEELEEVDEDDETDDDEEDDDEESFELDDAPSHRIPERSSWSPFGPAFGKVGVGAPNVALIPARRHRQTNRPQPPDNGAGTDPRTRLRAITAELDVGKPHGPSAVKLLVEATSYLTGGVSTRRQYGEARGCAPQDIAAAERAVVGKAIR